MHGFWYYYVKAKFPEKRKLCYMDSCSFIFHVKTDDICKDMLTQNIGIRFDSSTYQLERPLSKGEKKR